MAIDRHLAITFAFLAVVSVTVGCLQEEREPTQAASASEAPEPRWTLEGSVEAGFLVGAGAGDVTVVGTFDPQRCPTNQANVPASATSLTIEVDTEVLDPDEPGAGTYGITVDGGNETARREPAPGGSTVTFSFDDPAAGPWQVALNARGLAANQHWDVSFVMEGTGSPPDLWGPDPLC